MDSCCHPLVAEGAASLDLALVALTGLTVSLGHCVGMCGPIQTAFAMERDRQGARGGALLGSLLLYHGGRILAYGLIGAAFGLAGATVRLGSGAREVQGVLALVLGGGMLLLALSMLTGFGSAGLPDPWGVGRRVGERIRRLIAARSARSQAALGLANGFLPCGPVLAVALGAAAAAHPGVGGLLLVLYGLGTLPVLLILGLAAARISPAVRARLNRLGAVFLAAVAAQLVLRGLATLEVVPHLRWGEFVVY